MGKRVLKVRNALTGVVREVVLPGKPAPKKELAVKLADAVVDGVAKGTVAGVMGESDGQGNG